MTVFLKKPLTHGFNFYKHYILVKARLASKTCFFLMKDSCTYIVTAY